MTRAPWVLPKPERPFPRRQRDAVLHHAGLADDQPEMPDEWTVALGESTELLADKYGITREAQDAFALAATSRPPRPGRRGVRRGEVVPVPGAELARDEGIRDGVTLESLAPLKPSFRARTAPSPRATPPRSTTAPRPCCSPTRTGSPSSAASRWPGSRPPASTRVDPQFFGIGPVEAVDRALPRPAAARPTSHHGAQRGVRRPVAGLPVRVARPRPGGRQPARRRDRDRPPARRARAPGSPEPSPTSSPRPAPASASRPCASASDRASPCPGALMGLDVRSRQLSKVPAPTPRTPGPAATSSRTTRSTVLRSPRARPLVAAAARGCPS